MTKHTQMLTDDLVRKDQERQEALVRFTVSKVSRGNVNLQRGLYITENDKERMREQVFSYVIKAPI